MKPVNTTPSSSGSPSKYSGSGKPPTGGSTPSLNQQDTYTLSYRASTMPAVNEALNQFERAPTESLTTLMRYHMSLLAAPPLPPPPRTNVYLSQRKGLILSQDLILKSDHFRSTQNRDVPIHIWGAPNFTSLVPCSLATVGQPTVSGIRSVLNYLRSLHKQIIKDTHREMREQSLDQPLVESQTFSSHTSSHAAFPPHSSSSHLALSPPHGSHTPQSLQSAHSPAHPPLQGPSPASSILPPRVRVRFEWICVREEPVLYLGQRPFVLRELTRPRMNMSDFRGIDYKRLDEIERKLRRDVMEESKNYSGNVLIHDEDDGGDMYACWCAVNTHSDDDSDTSDESEEDEVNTTAHATPNTVSTSGSANGSVKSGMGAFSSLTNHRKHGASSDPSASAHTRSTSTSTSTPHAHVPTQSQVHAQTHAAAAAAANRPHTCRLRDVLPLVATPREVFTYMRDTEGYRVHLSRVPLPASGLPRPYDVDRLLYSLCKALLREVEPLSSLSSSGDNPDKLSSRRNKRPVADHLVVVFNCQLGLGRSLYAGSLMVLLQSLIGGWPGHVWPHRHVVRHECVAVAEERGVQVEDDVVLQNYAKTHATKTLGTSMSKATSGLSLAAAASASSSASASSLPVPPLTTSSSLSYASKSSLLLSSNNTFVRPPVHEDCLPMAPWLTLTRAAVQAREKENLAKKKKSGEIVPSSEHLHDSYLVSTPTHNIQLPLLKLYDLLSVLPYGKALQREVDLALHFTNSDNNIKIELAKALGVLRDEENTSSSQSGTSRKNLSRKTPEDVENPEEDVSETLMEARERDDASALGKLQRYGLLLCVQSYLRVVQAKALEEALRICAIKLRSSGSGSGNTSGAGAGAAQEEEDESRGSVGVGIGVGGKNVLVNPITLLHAFIPRFLSLLPKYPYSQFISERKPLAYALSSLSLLTVPPLTLSPALSLSRSVNRALTQFAILKLDRKIQNREFLLSGTQKVARKTPGMPSFRIIPEAGLMAMGQPTATAIVCLLLRSYISYLHNSGYTYMEAVQKTNADRVLHLIGLELMNREPMAANTMPKGAHIFDRESVNIFGKMKNPNFPEFSSSAIPSTLPSQYSGLPHSASQSLLAAANGCASPLDYAALDAYRASQASFLASQSPYPASQTPYPATSGYGADSTSTSTSAYAPTGAGAGMGAGAGGAGMPSPVSRYTPVALESLLQGERLPLPTRSIWVNLREEPVIYLRNLPFVLRSSIAPRVPCYHKDATSEGVLGREVAMEVLQDVIWCDCAKAKCEEEKKSEHADNERDGGEGKEGGQEEGTHVHAALTPTAGAMRGVRELRLPENHSGISSISDKIPNEAENPENYSLENRRVPRIPDTASEMNMNLDVHASLRTPAYDTHLPESTPFSETDISENPLFSGKSDISEIPGPHSLPIYAEGVGDGPLYLTHLSKHDIITPPSLFDVLAPLGVTYVELPLPSNHPPPIDMISKLIDLVDKESFGSLCSQIPDRIFREDMSAVDQYYQDYNIPLLDMPNIIFNCHRGTRRSALGLAVSVLVLLHNRQLAKMTVDAEGQVNSIIETSPITSPVAFVSPLPSPTATTMPSSSPSPPSSTLSSASVASTTSPHAGTGPGIVTTSVLTASLSPPSHSHMMHSTNTSSTVIGSAGAAPAPASDSTGNAAGTSAGVSAVDSSVGNGGGIGAGELSPVATIASGVALDTDSDTDDDHKRSRGRDAADNNEEYEYDSEGEGDGFGSDDDGAGGDLSAQGSDSSDGFHTRDHSRSRSVDSDSDQIMGVGTDAEVEDGVNAAATALSSRRGRRRTHAQRDQQSRRLKQEKKLKGVMTMTESSSDGLNVSSDSDQEILTSNSGKIKKSGNSGRENSRTRSPSPDRVPHTYAYVATPIRRAQTSLQNTVLTGHTPSFSASQSGHNTLGNTASQGKLPDFSLGNTSSGKIPVTNSQLAPFSPSFFNLPSPSTLAPPSDTVGTVVHPVGPTATRSAGVTPPVSVGHSPALTASPVLPPLPSTSTSSPLLPPLGPSLASFSPSLTSTDPTTTATAAATLPPLPVLASPSFSSLSSTSHASAHKMQQNARNIPNSSSPTMLTTTNPTGISTTTQNIPRSNPGFSQTPAISANSETFLDPSQLHHLAQQRAHRGLHKVIVQLIRALPRGREIKEEVDTAIDLCGQPHNLRECVQQAMQHEQAQRTSETITLPDGSRAPPVPRSAKYLEAYSLLVCLGGFLAERHKYRSKCAVKHFDVYQQWREQYFDTETGNPKNTASFSELGKIPPPPTPPEDTFPSFADWLRSRPELVRLLSGIRKNPAASSQLIDDNLTHRWGHVLTRGSILKSDTFAGIRNTAIAPLYEGVINFRLVAPISVAGVGIPTISGLKAILRHLTGTPVSPHYRPCNYKTVLWLNLREEPIVFVRGHPYVLRDLHNPYANVENTGIMAPRTLAMERQLRRDAVVETLLGDGTLVVHDEDKDGCLKEDPVFLGEEIEQEEKEEEKMSEEGEVRGGDDAQDTHASLASSVQSSLGSLPSQAHSALVTPEEHKDGTTTTTTSSGAGDVDADLGVCARGDKWAKKLSTLRSRAFEETLAHVPSTMYVHGAICTAAQAFDRAIVDVNEERVKQGKESVSLLYYRTPVTDEQAPIPIVVNEIIAHLDEALRRTPNKDLTVDGGAGGMVVVTNCQMGRGRTTTAMIISCLWALGRRVAKVDLTQIAAAEAPELLEAKQLKASGQVNSGKKSGTRNSGDAFSDDDASDSDVEEKSDKEEQLRLDRAARLKEGWYRCIKHVVRVLPGGADDKTRVDRVIDLCGAMQNLRHVIYQTQELYEGALESKRAHLAEKGKNFLIRYAMLLCIGSYLFHSPAPVVGSSGKRENPENAPTFSEWLHQRPEIAHALQSASFPE